VHVGIFENFRGEKGIVDHQSSKFYLVKIYLLINLNNFVLRKIFLVFLHLGDSQFWLKIMSEENMKVQSHQFHIYIEFDWGIRFGIQNLLCDTNHKSFLRPIKKKSDS